MLSYLRASLINNKSAKVMWYNFDENRKRRNSESLLWWNHRRLCFDKGTESVVLFYLAFWCNLTGKGWICLCLVGIAFFEQKWYNTDTWLELNSLLHNSNIMCFISKRNCRLQLQYVLWFFLKIYNFVRQHCVDQWFLTVGARIPWAYETPKLSGMHDLKIKRMCCRLLWVQ